MSTLIQIKRTNTANLPSTLDQGEFAYIYDTSSTDTTAGGLGGRLYIGDPTANSNTPIKIGGKYYVDLLDHSHGTLTARASVIVDADKKINEWFVDNLKLDGNTISSTDANGNITLSPNGNGKTVIQNIYVGDANTSLEEYIEDITGGSITAGTALTLTYDDVAGTITLAVAAGGIGTTQLADTAVTTGKLADGSVTTAKISDSSVTTAKLAADAVSTDKILDANVTTAKIADDAITADKLKDSATTDADRAVTTNHIRDNAVTAAKLTSSASTDGDRAVTSDHIRDSAVTSDKITAGAIITSKITDLNVTTAKIANNAVSTAKIADGAITAAKLGAGAVDTTKISDGSVTNAKLANSSITIGSDATALGTTITDLNGLTSIDVDNVTIDGNAITTTDTDGALALAPNGEGTVTVPAGYETRTGFGNDSLVNKRYVDQVAQGLDVKESVVAATTANLSATYDNTDGTLTGSANGAIAIDGVSVATGDRVLVKNQTDLTENGIYVVTDTGADGVRAFVLTRAPDADTANELTGGTFFFVERGTAFADSGFVATHNGVPTFGTTDITFEQFSGAGQLSDGSGLSKTGNTINVNTDDVTIEVNGSDDLQLKDGGITNAKISASAAIAQSKLNLNSATSRASATGITQADLGLASFNSAQFTVTNGWAAVTRLDAGAYS
jgi:hypothetical protein